MSKKEIIWVAIFMLAVVYVMLLLVAHFKFGIRFSDWRLYIIPFIVIILGAIGFACGGSIRHNERYANLVFGKSAFK